MEPAGPGVSAAAAAAPGAGGQTADVANAVIKIDSLDGWKSRWQVQRSSDKLMVVDFSARWCGPCRFIEPAIKDLAAKYKDVEFVTIDVDDLEYLALKWKVKAMPTFFLLKGGRVMYKIVGAKKNELDRKIQTLVAQSAAK